MRISAITPTQVWAASARSLTNIGSGALASTSTVNSALAGAASIDLRTSAGTVGQMTAGIITGAGATAAMVMQIWDGTTPYNVAVTASSASAQATGSSYNTASVGVRLSNADATHAGNYLFAAFVWTI